MRWTLQMLCFSLEQRLTCQCKFTITIIVQVDEDVKIKYDDIKKMKSYRYVVFFIKDEKKIVVEKVGARDLTYSSFLNDLTASGPDDCR